MAQLEVGMFSWIEHRELPGGQRQVFEEFLQLVEAADKAGLYAVQVAEHQGTPLSIDVSPNIVLSAVAQRTQRIRMGSLTWCLPWYDPYRLYNELCMLDQMSGGRIELGVGRGVSPIESRYYGLQSIEESREKYRECLDVLFAAFGNPVLNYQGKHYQYHDIELHNQPYQQPYPPLWFPTSQAHATLAFVAEHGYHTAISIGDVAYVREQRDRYWDIWRQHQHDPGRHNAHVARPFVGAGRHVVVAPTEAEAVRLATEATEVWGGRIGYLGRKMGAAPNANRELDYEARAKVGHVVAGTPEQVAQILTEHVKATGVNYLLLTFGFGDLTHQQAMQSLSLFGEQVLPKLQALEVE